MKEVTGNRLSASDQVLEGNKIIAEFDGKKYKPIKAGYTLNSCNFIDKKFSTEEACLKFCDKINKGKHPDECYFPLPDTRNFEWQYHTSWDWLMLVVRKFDYLTENKVIESSDMYEYWCDQIEDKLTRTYEIEPVFNIMVEAIEWYNNTQKAKI